MSPEGDPFRVDFTPHRRLGVHLVDVLWSIKVQRVECYGAPGRETRT